MDEILLYVNDLRTEQTVLCFKKEAVSSEPIHIPFKIFWIVILVDTIPSETLEFHKKSIFIIFT